MISNMLPNKCNILLNIKFVNIFFKIIKKNCSLFKREQRSKYKSIEISNKV